MVEEIAPGIVLLNNFNGTILIESTPQNLNGTFLIKFSNISINIEGKSFTSREESRFQILPAILHPLSKEKEIKKILSLEMMEELHINNSNSIEMLQSESKTNRYSMLGSSIVIIIILLILGYKLSKQIINNTMTSKSRTAQEPISVAPFQLKIQAEAPDSPTITIPNQSTTVNQQIKIASEISKNSKPKFNDIPYF